MHHLRFLPTLLLAVTLTSAAQTSSQTSQSALPETPQPQATASPAQAVTLRNLPAHFLHDQAVIWTSPARIRPHDLLYLAPFAAATGAAIATDHRTLSTVVSHDASFNNANVNASNVLIGGLLAAPVALFGVGQFHSNPHAREAGLLGSEAILDGLVVEQGLKLLTFRERPTAAHSSGRFWQTSAGVDSSFPSSHAVLAWSSAAVLASEYHSPFAQLGIYSLATGVSLTRVLGQQHFPSDVLVGSAAGWLVGHYVYRAHHRHPRD